jgi:hypothetical protein
VFNLLVGKRMWYCLCVCFIIDEKRGLRGDQDLYEFRSDVVCVCGYEYVQNIVAGAHRILTAERVRSLVS